MTFKEMMMDMRRIMLCCSTDKKKHSLEISSPTDVRHGVLEMPGLTNEQITLIREKATTDAARLLSLTSHPPTRPPSTYPHPSGSASASGSPSNPPSHSSAATSTVSLANSNSSNASPASSRTPSTLLLNSASANLPTTLPTPPRQKHHDTIPPTSAHSRIKGFWERTRRLSEAVSTHSRHSAGGYSHSHAGYDHLGSAGVRGLRRGDGSEAAGLGEEEGEGLVLLNLDFKDTGFNMGMGTNSEMELDSPVSGKSMHVDVDGGEGFEVQDVVGGATATATAPYTRPATTDIKLGADSENAAMAGVGKHIDAHAEAKKRRDAVIAKAIQEAGEVQSDASDDEEEDAVLGTAECKPLVRV